MKVELLGATLIVLALGQAAGAQSREDGDPAEGRELASQLCTACHIVGTERRGSDVAPPFRAIARDPEITVSELHGWIGPAHPMLPNLALTSEQTADINAYLDSLREGTAAPASEKEEPRPEEDLPGGRAEEPPPAIEQSPPERIGPPIEPDEE